MKNLILLSFLFSIAGCRDHSANQTSREQLPPPAVIQKQPNMSGVWEVHRGKAVDELTIEEKDGVITGHIRTDPAFDGGTYDVHGLRVASKVEWSYDLPYHSKSSGDGTVLYNMSGTFSADSMGGDYSVKGPFTSSLPENEQNERVLWVANRR